MSKENIEVVRAIYARWERGDFTWVGWADPEIEYSVPGPDPKVYRGIDAMNRSWRDWLDVFEEMTVHATEFHDSGDHVVAAQAFHGTGRGSGFPLDFPGAVLFTLRAGKVIRLQGYTAVDEALAALGDAD